MRESISAGLVVRTSQLLDGLRVVVTRLESPRTDTPCAAIGSRPQSTSRCRCSRIEVGDSSRVSARAARRPEDVSLRQTSESEVWRGVWDDFRNSSVRHDIRLFRTPGAERLQAGLPREEWRHQPKERAHARDRLRRSTSSKTSADRIRRMPPRNRRFNRAIAPPRRRRASDF